LSIVFLNFFQVFLLNCCLRPQARNPLSHYAPE